MATTAENLRELLPAAEPKPPPNLLPELPAPPGVSTKSAQPGDLMSSTAPAAPSAMTTSQVQPKETVAGQMNELLSSGSSYIQQARGGATRAAAARGLQNSSIAAQAGEQAAISQALPIASQDAGAFERRELTRLGAENQRELMGAQGDISSRLQSEGHAQQLEQIQAQGGVSLQLQERENANRQWLAQFDATTQEKLQGIDLATRERMQAAGFTQEQVLQAAEQQQQQWLAQFDAGTREKLQGLDADVRREMQALEIDAQERIANLNVNAASRNDAARMATSMELAYSAMLESLANNPDIPADARQTYMDHANTIRDSNLALVEQMFDIDLDWGP